MFAPALKYARLVCPPSGLCGTCRRPTGRPKFNTRGEEVRVIGKLLTQGGMASVYLGQRVAPGGFAKTVVLRRLRPS